jgi:hypothetical protein
MEAELLRMTGRRRLGRLSSEPYIAAQEFHHGVTRWSSRIENIRREKQNGAVAEHQGEVCGRLPASIPKFSWLPE